MARSRVYRPDISCPDCGSNGCPRTAPPQVSRFIAAETADAITITAPPTRPSAADWEPAQTVHGEGVPPSAIARIVGVTPPAVIR